MLVLDIELPFFGQISEISIGIGVAALLLGYVIGMQLKHGLKYAIIALIAVSAMGLIAPSMIANLAQTITALQPLYMAWLGPIQNISWITMLGIGGLCIGLLKG